jgi:ketosteroid isomerase-like protein
MNKWEPFLTFMKKLEAAEVEFACGRPDNLKALWAREDDVTLYGALGGPIEVGYENVTKRLDWSSAQYSHAARSRSVISQRVWPDLAHLVQNETIVARLGDGTGEPFREELRVSMLFRRNKEGEWCIIHRHADTHVIPTPRR